MAKRQFQLTEKQNRELRSAYENCADGPLRTRLQAVRLYGNGWSVADIQEIVSCSHRSLLRWCQKYHANGLDALDDRRNGGNRALLSKAQIAEIREKLHDYRPIDILGPGNVATPEGVYWSVDDLQQALQLWYGVTYRRPTSYHQLLKRCGFSYQRPARVYRSRSARKVAEFEEQLEKN